MIAEKDSDPNKPLLPVEYPTALGGVVAIGMYSWLFGLAGSREALEAILSQSFSPSEVIVIDDGSTDNSVQVIESIAKKNPAVQVLDGLTVLQHRLGILNGFVECEREGYLRAEIDGLTNTLRFKHKKPLVNLPSVEKPWGKEIRSCLTAPQGYLLCGADMTLIRGHDKETLYETV